MFYGLCVELSCVLRSLCGTVLCFCGLCVELSCGSVIFVWNCSVVLGSFVELSCVLGSLCGTVLCSVVFVWNYSVVLWLVHLEELHSICFL